MISYHHFPFSFVEFCHRTFPKTLSLTQREQGQLPHLSFHFISYPHWNLLSTIHQISNTNVCPRRCSSYEIYIHPYEYFTKNYFVYGFILSHNPINHDTNILSFIQISGEDFKIWEFTNSNKIEHDYNIHTNQHAW